LNDFFQAGQDVPPFLQQYADGASAGFTGGYRSKTADVKNILKFVVNLFIFFV
jgi:hypothetical protein